MKKNGGITLIALIITIIIMLILVAVSISILINSGLIGKAKKAGEDYQTSYEQEQRIGENVNVDGVEYTLDEYIDSLSGDGGTVTEVHNWERGTTNETRDILTCNHCSRELEIGETIAYDDIVTFPTSSSIADDKSGKLDPNFNPYGTYDNNNTITISTAPTWVVLGAEDSNGNGTNETLLITTESPTEDQITLCGEAPYNNWITEANRMAKELYGENARGMTIEDINNCFQYEPAGGMYGENYNYYTTEDFSTLLQELPIWSSIQSRGTHTPDGSVLAEDILSGYSYEQQGFDPHIINLANRNIMHEITVAEANLIFGSAHGYRYWLTSCGISADTNYAQFGPGIVYLGTASSYGDLFSSDGHCNNWSFNFRVVVSLTTDVPE